MTPEQCRQARELLGWTDVHLAKQAGTKTYTVRYVESGNGRPRPLTLASIRNALEAGSIEFIRESGGDVGVRLQRQGSGDRDP